MAFVTPKRISLNTDKRIKECDIRDYIFKNPNVLGLGELISLSKEVTQPSGGRIDLLFSDRDNNRYEIELQLGCTDPSHIIRTIEYWDNERKRYPQYNHYAVIIAEEITSRFQNVISLFNSHIPLIAIQLTATQLSDGEIALNFIKIMDLIKLGTDEEMNMRSIDRNYWEQNPKLKDKLLLIDQISDEIFGCKKYNLNYTKYYIYPCMLGINYSPLQFVPQQNKLTLRVYIDEDVDLTQELNNFDGFDEYKNYSRNDNHFYNFCFRSWNDFDALKEYIKSMVKFAIKNKGIIETADCCCDNV